MVVEESRDDHIVVDMAVGKGTAQWAMGSVLESMGGAISMAKRFPMRGQSVVLGVHARLDAVAASGEVIFAPKLDAMQN
eukprot:1344844-Alexandrium_andersonii.AAC.1